MRQVTVRRAKLEDLETLLEFEQGIISAERPFDPTLKPDPISYYDLKELIESPSAEVLVAEVDDEIAGSGYAKILEAKPYSKHDRYSYLGFMFVPPQFRGMGVIQKVIDGLVKWSKTQGLTELRLEVYDENLPAISAYKKSGFTGYMLQMRLEV